MLLAAALLLSQVAPVLSQGQPVPAQPVPQVQPPVGQGDPQPAAPDTPRKPDTVFEAIGKWWGKSAADLKQSIEESNAKWRRGVDENNAKWKQGVDDNNAKWRELNAKNEQAAKEAAAASREAAEAFKNLSNVRIVEGRQVCETAANGSPDCQTAAEVFCKSKGFATGKSADITTSRKCSVRSILNRDERECKVETTIVKAACQ